MSAEEKPFVSLKYGNIKTFLGVLGLSDRQIKNLSEEQRNRYQSWVLEGQNNLEAALSDISPDITIEPNSPAYTFAANAVINWAVYKKRSRDGSKTKEDAKQDFEMNIQYIRNVLTKERGTRVKAVMIPGKSRRNPNILLPSQLDTAFFQNG